MRYKFATSTTLSDNGKESLAICQLCKLLGELDIDIVNNRNIFSKHLRDKGLHLNTSRPMYFRKLY